MVLITHNIKENNNATHKDDDVDDPHKQMKMMSTNIPNIIPKYVHSFCAGMTDTPQPEVPKFSFLRKQSLLWLIILLSCVGLMVFREDVLSIAIVEQIHSSVMGSIRFNRQATTKSNFSVGLPTAEMMNTILLWTFSYYSKPMNLDKQDIATFECGKYKCGVTKNRHHLQKSKVIIFNPKYSNSLDLPKWREPWQRWAL